MSAPRCTRWRRARRASSSGRWRRTGLSGSTRMLRWRTRWMTGRPSCWSDRWIATAANLGERRRGVASALRALRGCLADACATTCWHRSEFRAIRCAWRGSAWRRYARRAAWLKRAFAAIGRAPCSPASRRIPPCRWRRRWVRASDWCWGFARTPWAGPFRAAERRRITDALAGYLRSLGGEIVEPATPVTTLPDAPVVMCDVTPRQMLALGRRSFSRAVSRRARALSLRAGRVQGGLGAGRAHSLACAGMRPRRHGASGRHARGDRAVGSAATPGVRSSCWCSTRCSTRLARPPGKHTAWAYCHVPNGSTVDMTQAIEDQVERFAPGFRARILARQRDRRRRRWSSHNPNLVGGDFNGGALDVAAVLPAPDTAVVPDAVGWCRGCAARRLRLAAGVHGMCGYHAASKFLQLAR